MNSALLTLITFAPLVGAILVLLPLGKWLGWSKEREEQIIKNGSVLYSLLPLGLSIVLWFAYDRAAGNFQFQVDVPWISILNINYHLGVDGFSVPLVFLTTLDHARHLVLDSGDQGARPGVLLPVLSARDGHARSVRRARSGALLRVREIGLVPMYFLIGIWGQPKDRPQYSAIKFFLFTLAGSVFMLLAIIAIYLSSGTWDIVEAAQLQPFAGNFLVSSLAFWAFFLAFAIKVPSWPLHTWLPDAHTAAPTAGSVILAGVMLKLGAYGIIRIALPIFPETMKSYGLIIVILGVISIIYGALVSLAQWDLKRLIAYSSVSHMGYILLGVGAAALAVGVADQVESSTMALNGAALQMFNHGISTGALFFLVGVIYERAHLRDLKMFGGLSGKTPYYYGLFAVTAFASLGLPGLAGFWGEFFVFRGAFDIVTFWAFVGVIGIVLTAAYILWKMIQYMFLGPYDPHKIEHWTDPVTGADEHEPTDVAPFEKVTLWPLVFFMVLIGIVPAVLLTFFNPTFLALMSGFVGK
jgi:NADH-quinone oxidoreductase subunit M